MLTIKVCFPDGRELVKEVASVMARPASESASGRRCITYFAIGDEARAVDVFDGSIYVMNSNGKTVADYYLDDNIK